MTIGGRSTALRRPMARRRGRPGAEWDVRAAAPSGVAPSREPAAATPRLLRIKLSRSRIGVAAVVAILAAVTIVGALSPSPVAGGAGSTGGNAGAASTAASSVVGAAWGGTGGIDVLDLATKGGLVLILLFITLRVLGRMQSAGPRRSGTLNVLESRTLASKASLHLVAVGDRRLVVGLTPNGMVALAELDAAELEDAQAAESPAGEPASPTTPSRRAAGQSASGLASGQSASGLASGQVPFAATFNTLMAPIDGFTDRLAGFFNGGRAR